MTGIPSYHRMVSLAGGKVTRFRRAVEGVIQAIDVHAHDLP